VRHVRASHARLDDRTGARSPPAAGAIPDGDIEPPTKHQDRSSRVLTNRSVRSSAASIPPLNSWRARVITFVISFAELYLIRKSICRHFDAQPASDPFQ
jgi:hypothetical protein